MQPINIDEYEQYAKNKLDKIIFDYFVAGAQDEITLRRNREAFHHFLLLPRVLTGIKEINLTTKLFKDTLQLPFLIAPMAFQCAAHPDGEKAMVLAAHRSGIGMISSVMSTFTIEEIAQTIDSLLFFQLYIYKNRLVTEHLIKRAEAAGVKALVITVDTPIMGRREQDIRNQFSLPSHLTAKNFETMELEQISSPMPGSKLQNYTNNHFDKNFCWKDIAWIKSITSLPIILKGIMHPEDAIRSIDEGIAAIIISNHGGRQLDTMPSTIEMLSSVANAINKRIPIIIDGGFRRGIDVFKALALGADLVSLGRPCLWALATNGQEGVFNMIDLLKIELIETMILCGCSTIDDIHQQGPKIIMKE